MPDSIDTILSRRLAAVWTQEAHVGEEVLYLPHYVPSDWIEDGKLSRGRLIVLQSAGWEVQEIAGRRYLMPDVELTAYSLGSEYDRYRQLMNGTGRAEPLPTPEEVSESDYSKLETAILKAGFANQPAVLSSGARLLYPDSFQRHPDGSRDPVNVSIEKQALLSQR